MRKTIGVLAAVAFLVLIGLAASLAASRAQATQLACRAAARIDVAGDLDLYAIYNVSVAPTELVVPARSPVGYFAVENGTVSLPVQFNGTDLLVAVDTPGTVNVSYISLQATSKEGALWEANFTMPCEGPVILPSGSTPIYVTPVPLQAYTYNGSPVLVMPAGELTIDYMVPPPTSTSPAPSTPVSTSTSTTTSAARPPVTSTAWLYVVIVVVAVVIIAVLLLVRGRWRGQGGSSLELDDRDRAILAAMGKLGGEATASQIMSETNIPKTPLYRRLDKLVRMGVLEEESKGGVKIYRCRRPGCK